MVIAEQTVQQIFWVAGISTSLLILLIWLIAKIRRKFWFEVKLLFLRPFGYGVHRIINSNRLEEEIISKIKSKEVIIETPEGNQRYMIDPKLISLRECDRVPIVMHQYDNPYQLDPYNQKRIITVIREIDGKEHSFDVEVPELIYKPALSATEMDNIIIAHDLLAQAANWFKDNWKTLMWVTLGVGLIAVLTGVGVTVMLDKSIQESAAKVATVCTQQVVTG